MSSGRIAIVALLITATCPHAASASPCWAPERPHLPSSADDMRIYADLLKADFEAYLSDAQDYVRCLDAERARAFVEAQEVAEAYGRFLEAVE